MPTDKDAALGGPWHVEQGGIRDHAGHVIASVPTGLEGSIDWPAAHVLAAAPCLLGALGYLLATEAGEGPAWLFARRAVAMVRKGKVTPCPGT